MKTSLRDFVLLLFLSFPYFVQDIACLTDTLTTRRAIKDGETIISSGGSFELGFFSPRNTENRYVGIWYKKISIQTVVWVANRRVPLINTSGILEIIKPGRLVVRYDANNIIWFSNLSISAENPIAQLLDSGNLVVKDANDDHPDKYLWQSFDFPTDTLLPGMKLGWNFVTGLEVYLSSWKSDEDPAPGKFTYHCDPAGYPQNVLKRDSTLVYRTGPWNGLRFSGTPNLRKNPIFSFGLVFNKNEAYYSYELLNNSIITRFIVSQNGVGQRWMWVDRTKGWIIYLTSPTDNCDDYGSCGAYGSCNVANSPICVCLDKFVPKYPDEWIKADWSNGCQRKVPLGCNSGDGFLKYSGFKLPDTRLSWFNTSMSLEECKTFCLQNCSCTAYSSLDISNGGSGCLLWFDDLIDMKVLSEAGQDIYIRMSSSESVSTYGSDGKKEEILIISLSLSIGAVLIGLSLILYLRRRNKMYPLLKQEGMLGNIRDKDYNGDGHKNVFDLSTFDLSTIAKATDNFSMNNRLGEGGFGPVHKGVLQDGQELAVKRLSKTSMQGLDEFKNEAICIAKLQHRNLVKLLGCCIEGVERMLIYEYMPNKSLDSFIFDQTRSRLLDWRKRFHIIHGVARGLLYLHQDSRLRIIHRDLKASNILLDNEMNPKISDFGMARTFGGNETEANTSHVVGTHGYMSPEYAVDGLFSVKSDVFSFGVLVLEIVSGKRNRGFSHQDHQLNLLGHAWRLYKEERALELLDAHLGDSCHSFEVLRSIHVGLLCVQQCPDARPSMSFVVSMLSNEGQLPEAKQPGFYTERNIMEAEFSSSTQGLCSANEITITLLDAR